MDETSIFFLSGFARSITRLWHDLSYIIFFCYAAYRILTVTLDLIVTAMILPIGDLMILLRQALIQKLGRILN